MKILASELLRVARLVVGDGKPKVEKTAPGSKYRYRLTYPSGNVEYADEVPGEVGEGEEPGKRPGGKPEGVGKPDGDGKSGEGDEQSKPKKVKTPKVVKTVFTAEEHSLPKVASQRVKTEEEVYAQAQEAQAHMMSWLDRGEGIDKAIGAQVFTSEPTEEDYARPGPMVLTAPLKGKKRAQEKVESDYGGDWSRMVDVVRASIAVDSHEEVEGVVDKLRKSGMKLARKPKDRFAEPLESGYRDTLLSVEYPNGHVGELQLHVKPMLRAKTKAHKEYEVVRSIEGQARREGRDTLSDEEMQTVMAANQRMQATYSDAWEEATGGETSEKESVERTASRRHIVAVKTIFYEYDERPAMWQWGKLPVVYDVHGRPRRVNDMETFFREVRVITQEQFNAMLSGSGKRASLNLRRIAERVARSS